MGNEIYRTHVYGKIRAKVARRRGVPFLVIMITRLAITCLLFLGIGLSANAQVQQTFEYGGVERTYYLDLPADLATGAPLVFVLHGYGGSAWGIRNYSG